MLKFLWVLLLLLLSRYSILQALNFTIMEMTLDQFKELQVEITPDKILEIKGGDFIVADELAGF